jgi:hypothetical protein
MELLSESIVQRSEGGTLLRCLLCLDLQKDSFIHNPI